MGKYIGPVVEGPRIVPQGKARTTIDKLPNGHLGFRVTQPFIVGKHDGIDLGNFVCGDRILAPHDGYLRRRTDTYGALIVEITESDGMITAMGHLSSIARANGPVKRGQLVGYVGATGLDRGGCHIHLTRMVTPSRATVDPWPRLEQNRSAKIVGPGVNIRNAPNLTARIYGTTTATAYRAAYTSGWNAVKGGYHGLAPVRISTCGASCGWAARTVMWPCHSPHWYDSFPAADCADHHPAGISLCG